MILKLRLTLHTDSIILPNIISGPELSLKIVRVTRPVYSGHSSMVQQNPTVTKILGQQTQQTCTCYSSK